MAIPNEIAGVLKLTQSKTVMALILVVVLLPLVVIAPNAVWFCLGCALAIEQCVCFVINQYRTATWTRLQFYCTLGLWLLIPLGISGAASIRMMPHGLACLILVAAVIVATDSFGQVFGRKFGKRGTFFPNVSPNKSLVGAIAGLLGGWLIALITPSLLLFFPGSWSPVFVWQLTIVLCFVPPIAILGDLLASYVKRSLVVKDFSHVLGMEIGGWMDRFDSWLPSLFVVWLLLLLLSM